MTKPTIGMLVSAASSGWREGRSCSWSLEGSPLGNDVSIMAGPDVVGVRSGALAWTLLGSVGLDVLVRVCAGVAPFVAWIGAILNTANLPSKNWFGPLGGRRTIGFVLLAAVAYVIAEPDGVLERVQLRAGGLGARQLLGPGRGTGS